METSIIKPELSIIQNKIYEVRGLRVILDKDLAPMYEVTTSNLNKAVNRNIDRFPEDFMFQLNKDEFNLIFQNGTSSWGGIRKLPYAYIATAAEIAENDYNLNIPRYVDTFEEEAEIDIRSVQQEIDSLEEELSLVQKKMKGYLKELGY